MEKKIRILLVDDESDFTAPVAFWFESKGYAVSVVADGENAVKTVKTDPPDILFLDLNMPVIDGMSTLKRIRKFNKDIPVVMISAQIEDPRLSNSYEYGISGVFYKGKDFAELMSLLEVILRKHKELKNK